MTRKGAGAEVCGKVCYFSVRNLSKFHTPSVIPSLSDCAFYTLVEHRLFLTQCPKNFFSFSTFWSSPHTLAFTDTLSPSFHYSAAYTLCPLFCFINSLMISKLYHVFSSILFSITLSKVLASLQGFLSHYIYFVTLCYRCNQ